MAYFSVRGLVLDAERGQVWWGVSGPKGDRLFVALLSSDSKPVVQKPLLLQEGLRASES